MKLRLLIAAMLSAGIAVSAPVYAEGAANGSSKSVAKKEVLLTRVTPEYWRITFHNPPFNIFGPESIGQLNEAITAIERDPNLRVVVFDSDVPNFFLTHYDFVPPLTDTTSMPNGPTGLPPLPDMLVRLSKAPVVSITSIRGRATGVGSELALASDMRFASREKGLLSQWEIGAALVPGGGPMARLPGLIGRGRTLEVVLTGNDIDADLAERYGYVNRALPDAELDRFVDTMARRIAKFDKQTIRDIKHLVDVVTLPSNEQIGAGWDGFISSVKRPEAQQRIKQLMQRGLQKDADVEKRLPHYTGTLGESAK
jgi:enoyl-CoA hydratase/carnithine racemase